VAYGQGMTLDEGRKHFTDMLENLEKMDASPWPFLCASAMLEYLSKLSISAQSNAQQYIRFIEDYMPHTYKDYQFQCEARDLPYQMYYVLRCGLVHSFSLVPDTSFKSASTGRKGSIVIFHKGKQLKQFSYAHLTQFPNTTNSDAVLFLFDEFLADIKSAMEQVFTRAKEDVALSQRIEKFLKDNPPIEELSPGTAVSGVVVY
jgi:hypothetical protein